MAQTLETKLRHGARKATSRLQVILTTNLAARKAEKEENDKKREEERIKKALYVREYWKIWKKALQGARNLVAYHKTPEMQEMLSILSTVHGHRYEFIIHDVDAYYGGEYLAWRWTRWYLYMNRGGIYALVQQVGQGEPDKSEMVANLSDPCYYDEDGEVEWTLAEELGVLSNLYQADYEWIVESVKACQVWEGKDGAPQELPHEWQRMSWLAFLAICSQKEKLADIMEKAFKKLEEV